MSFVELARSTSLLSHLSDETQPRLQSFPLAFAAVLTCGTLNNFSYCLISGAAQNIARHFGVPNQVTLLTTAMNFAALSGTFISTRLLVRHRFYPRVLLCLSMTALAYLGIMAAMSLPGGFGFVVASIFACFGAMAQIFGEITNLAFLKSLPPELIGGWGAGTGIAGILGSLVYLVLTGPLHLRDAQVFALMIPTGLIYFAAFNYLHRQATRGLRDVALQRALGGASGEGGGQDCAAPATWQNVKAATAASGNILFNMVAVYCLEYTIYPGMDDRETLCKTSWYTAMWMCYNIGVTISRMSVAFARINRVWLLTLFQLLNVIGWTIEVYTGAIRNSLPDGGGYYIMATWMIMVGLCGGATYGNCMYLFNRQEGIPNELRELGINLGFMMSNIGITIATFSFGIFDVTIMRKSILYPDGCPGDRN